MFGGVFLSLVCLSMVSPFVQAQPARPSTGGLAFYDNMSELPRIYSNVESYYSSSLVYYYYVRQ